MKRIILILTLFLLIINPVFSASTVKKDISVQSVDGFGIKATLEYPKVKGKKDYSTVFYYTHWDILPSGGKLCLRN